MKLPEPVRAVSASQHGVVARAQLRAAGVSAKVIRHRLDSGAWTTLLSALVVDRNRPASDWQDAWALTLSTQSKIYVSGPVALRLHGWTVTLPGHIGRSLEHVRVPGATFLRTPTTGLVRDQLSLATPTDALLDSLVISTREQARALLDLSLQRHWITADDFVAAATLRISRGRTEAPRLVELVARASTGSRSEAEQRMWPILPRTGFEGWLANHPVCDATGRIVAELDFALPSAMLGIEVDGRAHHSDGAAFEYDRARQNRLVLLGWTILRFTWEQITRRPEEVLRTIRLAVIHAA